MNFFWPRLLFEGNFHLLLALFLAKMNPRFYDPFDENALSFVALNKQRRRRHSMFLSREGQSKMATASSSGKAKKEVSKVNANGVLERSGSFDKKAAKNGWPDTEPIWNRRDQTSPEAYVIYVFLNGDGLNCRNVSFTRLQLEVGGLRHVMELVAREFNARPKKLLRMDGSKLAGINELMTRGAYVLVQAGEKFHECWYYLPDYAVDTSISSDRVLVRRRGSVRAAEEARKSQLAASLLPPGPSTDSDAN